MKRWLSASLIIGALAVAAPPEVTAQGLPGFTLFGGPRRENQLSFRLDYGRTGHPRDRYRLRIPADKMSFAVNQFSIDYPDYFDGQFDVNLNPDRDPDRQPVQVRVRRNRDYEVIPLEDVIWDEENHVIEIYPLEPVAAGNDIEIVFSNVRNPRFGGMYYFNARVFSPGDLPMARYLGTWVLNISPR
ncbi:DUF2808 domain-containing protein [Geitlerinema sp. P-1104]|uniref:DUF2808 domain-containing protein n=1 Tax=Geitlerinema sp. P-1104 TaxID=2546230 RepID=UPI00147769C8|nr:DUF2808 domain-containing protein [Geitlerinema sp. P-1104]NMG59403.1 DUF2808 domain-containing protein [Geitlerinema sp. P-1104]